MLQIKTDSIGIGCEAPTSSNTLKIADDMKITNFYPIGAIYISMNSTNPSAYFGGTWEQWGQGKTIVGVDTSDTNFNTVEKTGGQKKVTLVVANLPAHTHVWGDYGTAKKSGGIDRIRVYGVGSDWSGASSTGGSQAHNNLQPYYCIYMWKRTA